MLTAVTWKWRANYRETFEPDHVNALHRAVRDNYDGDLRFVCITDDARGVECETHPIWPDCAAMENASGPHLPSCYRRLKIFSPCVHRDMGIAPGSRVVSLDLDMLVVGPLNPLWDRDDSFVGWVQQGAIHNRIFNGSMFLFRAGLHHDLWSDFIPDRSPAEAKAAGYSGSDQSWISYRMAAGHAGWTQSDGVYSYMRDIRRTGHPPPKSARVIVFHGKRKQWHPRVQRESPWILNHWRGPNERARPRLHRKRSVRKPRSTS